MSNLKKKYFTFLTKLTPGIIEALSNLFSDSSYFYLFIFFYMEGKGLDKTRWFLLDDKLESVNTRSNMNVSKSTK